MNKKEISMKKGQKVRILRTNQIATIVEVELIRKSGKVHRYCHLKMDKKPDLWMDASELGGLEGLKCGKDFGLLAYNDIPSYEVIDEGITSLSIDWEMMGNEAANFVLNNVPVQKFLPTEVRLRKSL